MLGRIWNNSFFLILIVLVISSYTHLWNPVGFPSFFNDEGTYLRRAFRILNGQDPQELSEYVHPYFGIYFLAGIFKIINYPAILQFGNDPTSVARTYI